MICPLFSIAKNEEAPCIKGACVWYVAANDDLGTPAECEVSATKRMLLDTRMAIQGVIKAIEGVIKAIEGKM